MEGKFAHILRNHCHHAGVVWARRYFAENHIVALDEHLHAEDAVASERVGHLLGYLLCFCLGSRSHSLRLPRVAVVAIYLYVTNWFAKFGAAHAAHGEQCYLIVEIHKAFHNHAACTCTSALLGNVPRAVDVVGAAHYALSVSR